MIAVHIIFELFVTAILGSYFQPSNWPCYFRIAVLMHCTFIWQGANFCLIPMINLLTKHLINSYPLFFISFIYETITLWEIFETDSLTTSHFFHIINVFRIF